MPAPPQNQQLNHLNQLRLQISQIGYAHLANFNWKKMHVCSPFSRLYYIESGNGFVQYGNAVLELKTGHFYFIPAGLTFNYWCDTSMDQLFFHVNLYHTESCELPLHCSGCAEMEIPVEEIKHILTLCNSGSLTDSLELMQILWRDIAKSLRYMHVELNAVPYSALTLHAIEYIKKHLTLKLTARQLAERLFVSETKLRQIFKAETGITIGAYIDNLLFFEAEKLLRDDARSIGSISDALGFCDQFYFSRKFRSRYGITPQKYRQYLKVLPL